MVYFLISERPEMIRQLLTADEFSRNNVMQSILFHFDIDLLIAKSKTRKVIELINSELAIIYTTHYTKQATDYKTESEWQQAGRQVKNYARPYWFIAIYDSEQDRMKLQARYSLAQTKQPMPSQDVMDQLLKEMNCTHENLAPPIDSINAPKASKTNQL